MDASAKAKTLSIKGKSSSLTYSNVLVGEVWLCSGQSNMGWALANSDDADLETMTANYPNLRLISVPQTGTQKPQNDFNGQWESTTPDIAKQFSAVGYLFGRRLHLALGVPVGLIDNAWGGSATESAAFVQLQTKSGKTAYGCGIDSSIEKSGLLALVSAFNRTRR
jgi:sialate O-acetylesterase